MFYDKKTIFDGVQIDNPMIFMPWDMNQESFINMFQNHGVSPVGEKGYFVKNVSIFGESDCNIGVGFDDTMRDVGIARSNYEEYHPDFMKSGKAVKTALIRSYKAFQKALVSGFLVDVQSVSDEEMNGWRERYPDSFARKIDYATGVCLDGWLLDS